jgi:4'-phosphopantetheinyl transferase
MTPNRVSSLSAGDVHVWTARLVENRDTTADLLQILDGQEQARAGRFSFEGDRVRFIQAHGMARRILADYSDAEPATLSFAHNPHGKPYLVKATNGPDLQFSLSHSGDCCLLAVRLDQVGIDVEELRDLPQAADIAQRYFTPSESSVLGQLTGTARRDAFFVLWTHKEAMVKALGLSLAADLARVAFDLEAVGGPKLLGLGDDREIAEKWCTRRVDPVPGYVAAMATRHPFRSFALRYWNAIRTD